MTLNELYPSKWLKAADLEGQPKLATIESMKLEPVEDGKPPKPVLSFRGLTQGLVLNKTNATTLSTFLGDDTANWPGQKIVMFPAQAPFQGKMVDCIRVRAPKPPPAASAKPAAPLSKPATPQLPSKVAEDISPDGFETADDDVPF